MLTQQEIYQEAIALPFDEQKKLIEKISQNLNKESGENGNNKSENEISMRERKAAYLRLRGVAKMENPPMTKEEVREDYYNYLAEKYK